MEFGNDGQLDQHQQEMARRAYELYAKQASWTLDRIMFQVGKLTAALIISVFNLAALIVIIAGADKAFLSLKIMLAGLVCGVITGAVTVAVIKHRARCREEVKLELSEGYTERFFEAAEASASMKDLSKFITLATAYNLCGEWEKTLEKLDLLDESTFVMKPTGAHMYYSSKLTAYVLAGDRENADAVYKKGFYYMNTYMNSPVYGEWVSLSFAMYEHMRGNYAESLKLLDNAAGLQKAGAKPYTRIPDENFRCVLCCWKAKNLMALGRTEGIRKMMEGCGKFYKTPFYEKMTYDIVKELNENEAIS